jgi:hypothetical protein
MASSSASNGVMNRVSCDLLVVQHRAATGNPIGEWNVKIKQGGCLRVEDGMVNTLFVIPSRRWMTPLMGLACRLVDILCAKARRTLGNTSTQHCYIAALQNHLMDAVLFC